VLVLGVVALVVLPLLALCGIVSCASTESPPGAEHARRLRAPWDGDAHVGSGARGEEGDGRSTRRVPGAPPWNSLWHAPCRAPSPMAIGLAPADMKRSASLRAGPARLRGIASASLIARCGEPCRLTS